MLSDLMNMACLDICNRMQPITLSEMKDVRLMNRIDTKYLAPASLLPKLLLLFEHDFRIQYVAGLTVSNYSTQYFDTRDLEMYTLHHNCKRPRQKVRVRTYLDSGITFLEIKKKNNKGRTDKVRIQLPEETIECKKLSPYVHDFLTRHTPYTENELLPHLNSTFERITLVNNNKSERITIDVNLHFHNCQNGNDALLPELMIIELKQDGKVPSKVKDYLTECHIPPEGISKYCLGTILTNPEVKNNRFKEKIRYIYKLTNQVS